MQDVTNQRQKCTSHSCRIYSSQLHRNSGIKVLKMWSVRNMVSQSAPNSTKTQIDSGVALHSMEMALARQCCVLEIFMTSQVSSQQTPTKETVMS